MYSRQNNPDRFAEPLMLLSTYRLDKRYQSAEQGHLIDLARSADTAHRPHLVIRMQRVGAALRTWCGQHIQGLWTGTTIPVHATAAFAADQQD